MTYALWVVQAAPVALFLFASTSRVAGQDAAICTSASDENPDAVRGPTSLAASRKDRGSHLRLCRPRGLDARSDVREAPAWISRARLCPRLDTLTRTKWITRLSSPPTCRPPLERATDARGPC